MSVKDNTTEKEAYLQRKTELDNIRKKRQERYAGNMPQSNKIQPNKNVSRPQVGNSKTSKTINDIRNTKPNIPNIKTTEKVLNKENDYRIKREIDNKYNHPRDYSTKNTTDKKNKGDTWVDISKVEKPRQEEKKKILSLKKAVAIAIAMGIPIAGISGILSYNYVSNSPDTKAAAERQEKINKEILENLEHLSYGKNNPDYTTTETTTETTTRDLGDER